jgi:hypothetical protein
VKTVSFCNQEVTIELGPFHCCVASLGFFPHKSLFLGPMPLMWLTSDILISISDNNIYTCYNMKNLDSGA